MVSKKPKALVLFSGGLDSILAMKVVMKQGVEVEAVHFVTPFSKDSEVAEKFCEEAGVKLHKIFLGQDYLDMIVSPKHGYGSQMNPCIDCRIFTFKKAKKLAEKIGADFLVTGEVLDERPFSQRKEAMMLIEREATLEGKILRPLSAKLLPESEPEKRGFIDRQKLYAIRGKRRTPQIELAKKLGIDHYPNPSGGCLLTDPAFAKRLREHLEHNGKLSLLDVDLLKIGRHFRIGRCKVVVGRNEGENRKLLRMADEHAIPYMKVEEYVGPITLILGDLDSETKRMAAAITARYSDAPSDGIVKVRYVVSEAVQILETKPIRDVQLRRFLI